MSTLARMSIVAGSVVALAIRRSAVSSVIVIGTHSRAWSDAWISTPGLLPCGCRCAARGSRTARAGPRPRARPCASGRGSRSARPGRSSPRRCRCRRWSGTGARGRSGPVSRPRSPPRPGPRCLTARRSRSCPAELHGLAVDLHRQRQVVARLGDELDRDLVAALMAPGGGADDDPGGRCRCRRSWPAPCAGSRWSCSACGRSRRCPGSARRSPRSARTAAAGACTPGRSRTCSPGSAVSGVTSRSQSLTLPIAWPPVLEVTRMLSGRVETLNRLRWNM